MQKLDTLAPDQGLYTPVNGLFIDTFHHVTRVALTWLCQVGSSNRGIRFCIKSIEIWRTPKRTTVAEQKSFLNQVLNPLYPLCH
jgi:hypothetical protein